MTTFQCNHCGKSWSMGPTRDLRLDETCHLCMKDREAFLQRFIDESRSQTSIEMYAELDGMRRGHQAIRDMVDRPELRLDKAVADALESLQTRLKSWEDGCRCTDFSRAEVQNVRAERERYRAALEAIVAGNKYSEYRDGEVRIAREALNP